MLRLQQQQQQVLQPQHTAIGSNNPFAQFSNASPTPETNASSTSPPPSSFSNLNAPSPMSSAWSTVSKPSAMPDISLSTPPPGDTKTTSQPTQSAAFDQGHQMLDTMFANKNAGLTKFEIDQDTFVCTVSLIILCEKDAYY